MTNKLLVVHPSAEYDFRRLTQEPIKVLSRQYNPDRLFVVYNKDDFHDYLGRCDIFHTVNSHLGEIEDQSFLRALLENCDNLTICGHTGGECHHMSFEAVVNAYRTIDDTNKMSITIPTYAVSSPFSADIGWPLNVEVEQLEHDIPYNHKLPPLLNQHRQSLAPVLTKREHAVLRVLYEYARTGIICYRDFSLGIKVDDRTVFEMNGVPQKKLEINFATRN